MNIILLQTQDFLNNSNIAIIRDYRFTHIFKVLNPSIGQSLKVGLLGGDCGYGIVESIDSQVIKL